MIDYPGVNAAHKKRPTTHRSSDVDVPGQLQARRASLQNSTDVIEEEVAQEQNLQDVCCQDCPTCKVKTAIKWGQLLKAMVPENQSHSATERCCTHKVACERLDLTLYFGHHCKLWKHSNHIDVQCSSPKCVKDRTVVKVWVHEDRNYKASQCYDLYFEIPIMLFL